MLQIDFLTDDANQEYSEVIMEDNDTFYLYLSYNFSCFAWFCNITYNGVQYNGIKITTQYNILRNYKNQLPFGISCVTTDHSDPYFQNDFSTTRAKLYLLNSTEL